RLQAGAGKHVTLTEKYTFTYQNQPFHNSHVAVASSLTIAQTASESSSMAVSAGPSSNDLLVLAANVMAAPPTTTATPSSGPASDDAPTAGNDSASLPGAPVTLG